MDGGASQGGGSNGSKKPRTIIVSAGAAGMALAVKLREASGTPDEYRELLRVPRLLEAFDLVRDEASGVGA